MPAYEYKIVPAPRKGLKGKGIKGAENRFSNALEVKMNEMAAEGWEYQRAETLPSLERSGLTSTTTEWRHVLVFRRPRESDAARPEPVLLPAATPVAPIAIAATAGSTGTATEAQADTTDAAQAPQEQGAAPETVENQHVETAESPVEEPPQSAPAADSISVSIGEPSNVIDQGKSTD